MAGINSPFNSPPIGSNGSGGVAVSLGGNTAGTSSVISTGTVVFAGGNNITLSQSGSNVTIQGATVAGQPVQVVAGGSTNNLGTVYFNNSNNVSFGLSGSTITASAAGGSNGVNIVPGGNTAGTVATVSSGVFTLAGGNNITLSQSGNAVTVSAANTSQSAQTVGVYGASNSTGQSSSSTYDARSLSFAGAGIISVGNSNGSVVISAPGTTSYAPLSVGMSTIGNTAGNTGLASNQIVFAGGNNVTLSGSTSAGSMTITISAGSAAAAPVNFSAGTASGNLGSVVFSNSNNVSFGLNGSTVTGSASYPTQTVQTLGFYASGNTTGNSSSATYDARSLSFAGYGIISVGNSNGVLQISGPNTTSYAPLSVGVSTIGNTAGNTAMVSNQLVLAGGNNITLSGSTSNGSMTLTISGAAGGGSGGFYLVPGGNTAGTTSSVTGGTMTLAGGNNITLSQSGNAITVSAPASSSLVGAGAITISTGGNTISVSSPIMSQLTGVGGVTLSTSGNTISVSAPATSSLLGGGVITISTTGNTISINAPAITQLTGAGLVSLVSSGSTISISGPQQLSFVRNAANNNGQTATVAAQNAYFYPANGIFPFSASRADVPIYLSMSSSSNSSHAGAIGAYVGIYTLTGSTLSLATSGSQSYAWSNTSNNSYGSLTGNRRLSVPLNVNYSGGDIFYGFMSTTGSTNANWFTGQIYGVTGIGMNPAPALIGQATNATNQIVPGFGSVSATTNALPTSVALSGLSSATFAPEINFANLTA